ncbi:O-antigen/teichoic acid export membrane protein [Bradyrhizobium sp. GM6.1]
MQRLRKGPPDLLGNSAWNATAFLVAAVLNLAILPFVIFRLGLPAFGVAGLVTACIAPALVFSNSLGLSTVRELAQRLAPSDREDARRLFATAVMLAMSGGGVITILLVVAGAAFARFSFHLGGPAADDLGLAFTLAGFGWLCQFVSSIFLSLFTARQDYRRIACISIVTTLVTTLSMLLLIPYAPRASTFLGCQSLGFAMNLLVALTWSRCAIGEWLAWPALHRDALGRLVKLGSWQFAAQGGALLAGQADR